MKKEKSNAVRPRGHALGRLLACFFCFCMGLLSLPSWAQQEEEPHVSIDVRGESFIGVIESLRTQTHYNFMFNSEELQGIGGITLRVMNVALHVALDSLLNIIDVPFPLSYIIDGKTVVIRRRIKMLDNNEVMTIVGRVVDEKGNPLPFVTVVLKGTMLGTATDENGNFKIQFIKEDNKTETLLFSYIGMLTREIQLTGDMKEELEIVMQPEEEELDEVVITGYQTVDRRKSTSSVTSVRMEDLNIPGVSSVDQMLQGQIPDLIFMSNSGEVGVVPRLRIRGTSTLIGNREPLWVLDGIILQDPVNVPVQDLNDPDYINRIGNAIAGINPQDIERIDVLKDAAATALYGTRAANGVIVVTTKKGRVGRPIVTYNMNATFRQRPSYNDRAINLMNSRERIQFSRELVEQHYPFPEDMSEVGYEGLLLKLYNHELSNVEFEQEVERLSTLNTDWFDLLTKNSMSHSHTISISGGSSDATYYASIGYTRDNDVVWDSNNERYTAILKMDANLTPWMHASLSINGNISSRRYYQQDLAPMDYAYKTSRALPAYDEKGEYFYFSKVSQGAMGLEHYRYNILNELENSSYDQRGSGVSLTANLQFLLTHWLTARAVVAYQASNTIQEGWWGEKTYYVAKLRGTEFGVLPLPRDEDDVPDYLGEYATGKSLLPYGGELSYNQSDNQSYTVRLQLDGNYSFGIHNQHNITGTAGFEISSTRNRGYSRTERGYYKDRGMSFVSDISQTEFPEYARWVLQNPASLTDGKSNTVSCYASLSYSYYSYFTVNVNARVDGSNAFGDRSNEKLLPIWSASANWNISELSGLKQCRWMDFLRVKASFGYQGNMLNDQSPVMIISKEPLNPYFGENVASVSRYPNPNLKWETTMSYNLGVELGLFQRMLMVEAEYWWKHTEDAFLDKTVAIMNGLPTDSYKVNQGNIDNHGYNVSLTFLPIQSQDWFWSISTSISKTFNKMKTDPEANQYELANFLDGSALVKGEPVGTFYSYKFIGLSPVNGGPMFDDYADNPEVLRGLSKLDTYTRVLTPSGQREPTMSGNLTTTLRWKNIRLSGNFAYSLGNKIRLFAIYSTTADAGMNVQDIRPENNVNKFFLDRWRKPGDERYTNIPAIIGKNDDNYSLYERHWSDSQEGIQPLAYSVWEMYDYANHRVVSGNYLKCSNLGLTYEFREAMLKKLHLSRLDLTLSAANLFTISAKELKGQTPMQGGFASIQLSERPMYTLGLTVSF